jgi:hypothetical protein
VALFGCSPAAGQEGVPRAQQAASSASPEAEKVSTRVQRVNLDAATVAEFQNRVKTYWELHQKVNGDLPRLGKEATPAEVDRNQRELARRISQARAAAKPGDVFTPAMNDFVRKLLAEVFSGTDGRRLRSTVMDENPVGTPVQVNGRYPDTVPLSTMPPDVLKSLPPTPEGLEYRFVGRRLVLLDVPAHLIVDFVNDALPL